MSALMCVQSFIACYWLWATRVLLFRSTVVASRFRWCISAVQCVALFHCYISLLHCYRSMHNVDNRNIWKSVARSQRNARQFLHKKITNLSMYLTVSCHNMQPGSLDYFVKRAAFVMPPPNVVWFCPVRPSCASRNSVSTISCRVFDTFSPTLHQRCIMGQKWMH